MANKIGPVNPSHSIFIPRVKQTMQTLQKDPKTQTSFKAREKLNQNLALRLITIKIFLISDDNKLWRFIHLFFYSIVQVSLRSNYSIDTGVFPSKMKTADIIPIQKKDDTTTKSYYRPITSSF